MDTEYYLYSLGLIPLLTARGILPLLASALIARFGMEFGFLADRAGVEILAGLPEWLQSDAALITLALLAALEHRLNRSPDLAETLKIGDAELKAIVGVALCLLMVHGAPGELEASAAVLRESGWFSFSFASFWSLLIGGAVWVAASMRSHVYAVYAEIDPDDAMGIRGLLTRLESLFAGLGPLIFVIFPLLAVLAAMAAIVSLKIIERMLVRLDQKQRSTCECGKDVHLAALVCGYCGVANANAQAVGFFGQPNGRPAESAERQEQALRAKSRCPRCAERVSGRGFDVTCGRCDHAVFADQAAADGYLGALGRKLPMTLLVTTLFGLIPVVGLIPGIVYYRLNLISSLRAYLSWGRSVWTRWLVRLACLVLVLLQALPLLGALALPLMCLINFYFYHAAARKQSRSAFA